MKVREVIRILEQHGFTWFGKEAATVASSHASADSRAGHGPGSARRRAAQGYVGRGQTPVRPSRRPVPLRMRGHVRPEAKLEEAACTAHVGQARHECQLGAYLPRCSPGEEPRPLLSRQFVDPLKVQLDTGSERRFHFVKGSGERCHVEVGADRLPLLVRLKRVATKREDHSYSRESSMGEPAIRCRQCTMGSMHVPAVPDARRGMR